MTDWKLVVDVIAAGALFAGAVMAWKPLDCSMVQNMPRTSLTITPVLQPN